MTYSLICGKFFVYDILPADRQASAREFFMVLRIIPEAP
jgi:hypothetical protein